MTVMGCIHAERREIVGVNELMIWHGTCLLVVYIIDGILKGVNKSFCEKTYTDIVCRYISVWMDLVSFIPFRRWKTMSLAACLLMDGASAEGQIHWLWLALSVIFVSSQVIEYANMVSKNHAGLSRKLKRKSHLSQRVTRCKFKAVIWVTVIYTARSMDGQMLNQVAELARAELLRKQQQQQRPLLHSFHHVVHLQWRVR